MTISFVKLSAVLPPPQDTKYFELTIAFEHGDADSHTKRLVKAHEDKPEQMEFLARMVKFLSAYEDYDQWMMGDRSKLHEVATAIGLTDAHFWEITDAFDRDMHYEGNFARVTHWGIVYINEVGDRYYAAAYEGETRLR